MSPLNKKTIIILLNAFIISAMLWLQNIRYNNLANFDFSKEQHGEVLRSVGLLEANGNDINWIMGSSLILLILNLILYKLWAYSNKWILEPVIIFFLTVILSLGYHYKKINNVKESTKTTANITFKKWRVLG